MSRKSPPKKKSKSKGQGGLKPEHLLIGAVVLGLGYYFLKGKNPVGQNMSAEAPVAAPVKGGQIQVLASNESQVDVRKYQEELNVKRAQFAQARILGLKTLDFKDKGDTVSIPLVFAPKKIWCQGGDLDTMKYASKSDKNKDFIISLEAIGRPGKNPFVRTSLKELYAGLNYTFTVPRPKDTTAYGLYICTDTKQENSCQRKTVESHAEMSEKLAQQGDKAKAQDRVFFFQNLILDSKKIESYRTDDFSPEFQKSINGHMVNKKGVNAADFQTAWNMNSTLKSSPTDVKDGKIILSLPYNDPRCVQGAFEGGPAKGKK